VVVAVGCIFLGGDTGVSLIGTELVQAGRRSNGEGPLRGLAGGIPRRIVVRITREEGNVYGGGTCQHLRRKQVLVRYRHGVDLPLDVLVPCDVAYVRDNPDDG